MRIGVSKQFWNDARGGVALMFGMVLPVLIGFSGVAVDGTYWIMERSKLQAATDSAALSAAQTVQLSGADPTVATEAQKMLQKTYGSSLTGVRFTVQHPPLTGPLAGNATAVAVLAERDQPTYFLGLFGVQTTFVATRSVARIDSSAEACVLALSASADKAVNISGSSVINLQCGIASNSNSSMSVYMAGSSNTSVAGVSAAGDIYQSNNAQLTTTAGPPKSYAAEISDPYGPEGRNLTAPNGGGACEARNLKVHEDVTLSPGRYCGGIDFTGGTTTFQPGVYIIDAGDFRANGNAALVGTDVTFILAGKNNSAGVVDIAGGGDVSLHAPKTDPTWKGILFFKDAGADRVCHGTSCSSTINGNATMDVSGAVYLPGDTMSISGGSASNIGCLQIVAKEVVITGNAKIAGSCDANSGAEKIKRTIVELVE